MNYIAEFRNTELNVTGLVYPLRGGFAAAVRDDDANKIAPAITIYPTAERAIKEAMRIADYPCGEKLLCECPQGICYAA